MMGKKTLVRSYVGFAGENCCILLCLHFLLRRSPFLIAFIIYPFQTKPGWNNGCSCIKHKGFIEYTYCLALYYLETITVIKKIKKSEFIVHSSLTVLEFVTEHALMRSRYLSGVLLLPCSFISNIISEESSGELALASRRSCSCWARY